MKKPKIPPKKTIVPIATVDSRKCYEPVNVYSTLARDFIYVLDIDSRVNGYNSESTVLGYLLNGNYITFIPDFEVDLGDGRLTAVIFRLPGHSEEMLAEMEKACFKHGLGFDIVTPSDVREQPRLRNAKFLSKYATTRITQDQLDVLNSYFRERLSGTVGELKEILAHQGIQEQILWGSLATELLRGDFWEPLSDASVIYPPAAVHNPVIYDDLKGTEVPF